VPGDVPPLAAHIAQQARLCAEMASPLYERLLRACVADLAEDGPVADVLADHLHAPGPAATGLRLLGGVHHLVLTGRAERLAVQFPGSGGTPGDDLVPAFLATLRVHREELAAFVTHPPQTNAVGRAGALVGGLLRAGGLLLAGGDAAGSEMPVRLHEIGASAGLLLNADRYRFQVGADGPWWGKPGAMPAFGDAWRGTAPEATAPLQVVERVGSDLSPVDLRGLGAQERLLAYVWADQVERLDATRAALAVAAEHPVPVQALDAVTAVERLQLRAGHLTVLWHSVMWQYLSREDQRAVTAALGRLGATATPDSPLLRLSMEPERPRPAAEHRFLVAATTWPGGERTVLGTTAGHGVPTTWHARQGQDDRD